MGPLKVPLNPDLAVQVHALRNNDLGKGPLKEDSNLHGAPFQVPYCFFPECVPKLASSIVPTHL